jgi:hypothetical protein
MIRAAMMSGVLQFCDSFMKSKRYIFQEDRGGVRCQNIENDYFSDLG